MGTVTERLETVYISQFRISNIPRKCSSYDVYNEFSQYGRIEMIQRKYRFYEISMLRSEKSDLLKYVDVDHHHHHPFSIGWMGDLAGTRKVPMGNDALSASSSTPTLSLSSSTPMDLTRQPEAYDSDHHILNALNDDCVRHIFESPALDLMDLIAIGGVCKHFHDIARNVFKRKYRELAQHFVLTTESLWQTEMFLRTFGNDIVSIDLTQANERSTDIHLRLILAHCTQITALKCEIYEDQSITAMRSILPRIRHFHVCMRESLEFLRLFDVNQMYQFQTLKTTYAILPIMQFPQLNELYIQANESRHQRFLERFFEMNPQIQILTMRHYDFDGNIGSLIQSLPHLSHLVVEHCHFSRNFIRDSYCFGQLKHLKVLRMRARNHDHTTLLSILQSLVSNNVGLEELTITGLQGYAVLLIDIISQMKSIQLLKIDYGDEECLMRLANGLTQLTDLSISCKFLTIDAIRNTLQTAQCLTKARFRVRQPIVEEDWMKCDVREEIDAIHQQRNINLRIMLRRNENGPPTFGVRLEDEL